MAATHYFASSADAYDACQGDDLIEKGDTLVILSERVVGIADVWPVAVTSNHGSLHQFAITYSDDVNAHFMGIDVNVILQARAFADLVLAL